MLFNFLSNRLQKLSKPKKQRLAFLTFCVVCLGISASLILINFRDHMVFFYTPTDLKEKKVAVGDFIRIGGVVKENTLTINPKTLEVQFKVTDLKTSLDVVYQGVVPDLLKEGQGVVAEGTLEKSPGEKPIFQATTLFAKHDETYMPPEVAESLRDYRPPQRKS